MLPRKITELYKVTETVRFYYGLMRGLTNRSDRIKEGTPIDIFFFYLSLWKTADILALYRFTDANKRDGYRLDSFVVGLLRIWSALFLRPKSMQKKRETGERRLDMGISIESSCYQYYSLVWPFFFILRTGKRKSLFLSFILSIS